MDLFSEHPAKKLVATTKKIIQCFNLTSFLSLTTLLKYTNQIHFQVPRKQHEAVRIAIIRFVQSNSKSEDQHCKHPLSNEQRNTLLEVVMSPRIEKLKTPSIVESKLLAIGDKRLYFLWGKIKQRCEVGDTIDLAQSQVLELVGGSTKGALDLVKSLVSVGALELVRKPKIGSLNGRGGKYRRIV